MASSMARRLALVVATVAAAMLVAVPAAQARTIYTLTGHGWGHGIGLSQYGALGYAQHGWAYDAILAHYYTGTTLSALPGSVQMRIQLASGRSSVLHFGSLEDHGRRRGRQHYEDPAIGLLPRRAGNVGPPARRRRGHQRAGRQASDGPGPARAPRRRFGSTAPSASAGRMTTGTARLRVIRSGSSLMLVDVVPLEYYLRGVVPSEMPSSWLAAGAPRAGRRRSLVRRRDTPPVVALRRLRRHAQPGLRPDRARGGRLRRPPSPHRAPGAVVLGQRRRRVLLVVVRGLDGLRAGRLGQRRRAVPRPVRDRYDGAQGSNPNHDLDAACAHAARAGARARGRGKVRSVDLTVDGPSQRVTHATFHRAMPTTASTQARGAELALGLRSNYFRIVGAALAAPARSIAGSPFPLTGRVWPLPHHRVSLLVHDGPGSRGRRPTPGSRSTPRASSRRASTRSRTGCTALALPAGAVSPRQKIAVGPELTLVRSGKAFRATIYPILSGREAHAPEAPARRLEGGRHATVGAKGHARFAVHGHRRAVARLLRRRRRSTPPATRPCSPRRSSGRDRLPGMPAFAIRRVDGKLRIRAAGCCNPASYRRSTSGPTWSRCSPRAAGSSTARATSCTSSTGADGPARSISDSE